MQSAVSLIQQHSLDGIDLDWEFPSGSREKARFVLLLERLREAFDAHPLRPILTVAVPAQSLLVSRGFDVPKIAKFVGNFRSSQQHSRSDGVTRRIFLASLWKEFCIDCTTE